MDNTCIIWSKINSYSEKCIKNNVVWFLKNKNIGAANMHSGLKFKLGSRKTLRAILGLQSEDGWEPLTYLDKLCTNVSEAVAAFSLKGYFINEKSSFTLTNISKKIKNDSVPNSILLDIVRLSNASPVIMFLVP